MEPKPLRLRSSMMNRLRDGLPITPEETDRWIDTPHSAQQLNALLHREIEIAEASETSLLVFRFRHRPFGVLSDGDAQFRELQPELRDRLLSVHPGVRAVGTQSGEILGFAPRLQRRTDGEELLWELTKALSEPVTVNGLRVLLGPRSGGAVLDDEVGTVEDMLSAAQMALDETDAAQVSMMFHPYQRSRHQRRDELARALHQAVVDRKMSVRYQPDIDLRTGELVAIKAYAHWQPEGESVVSNRAVFEAAEHASLSVPIGREVIEQALRSVYGWITTGLLSDATVWVNVHPSEVLAPDFGKAMVPVATYDERLRLGIELTDNPVEDRAYVFNVLRTLVANGATCAIGSFGSGQLDVAELQQLPFSAAKIDRALTRQITVDGTSMELVGAVLELARLLGLDVTAHGVETLEQVTRLRQLGCPKGQGFHFARPMSAEEMTEMLTQVRMGSKRFL